MPELDECDQPLVTNPFADDSPVVSSTSRHDSLVAVRSDQHPLRAWSTLPERAPSVFTAIGNRGKARPGFTRVLSLDGSLEDPPEQTTSEVPRRSRDVITHLVGPNDSFASVAVRYGVSIAALRRANHLWSSDPIHLRTELVIPRGDTFSSKCRPSHNASTDTLLGSAIEPSPSLAANPVTSSFVAARNMIFSVLPARISLDSLSSRTNTSEDHELDDLQSGRAPSAADPPFAETGYALSLLTAPHTDHKMPPLSLLSRAPSSPANTQHLGPNHIPPVDGLQSQSVQINALERLPRSQPFVTLPVRTSQLEPEPAMELPVRRYVFRS